MSLIVIGVDPGITGALSVFVGGALADIRDMPVVTTQVASKGSSIRDLIGGASSHKHAELDKPAIAKLLREWTGSHSAVIVCERVHTMPRQGVVSSGKLMRVFGVLEGVIAALSIELQLVEPAAWKLALGLSSDKNASRALATKLFPRWASHFKRVMDHNRAESCLIGWYGVNYGS